MSVKINGVYRDITSHLDNLGIGSTMVESGSKTNVDIVGPNIDIMSKNKKKSKKRKQ